ncbi:MAG: bifunctional 23S rRNA (guanine(2069)-N(7))-methyltransferase RlmK/23S rRNA (guanine(2445)-N(2))-methyltransferase RlmL [Gammaproteobacteria bacterium]|nr:bifunctional 23S rRNA (guanine(2069)-N(7))-methyltransferase RlmK/23S rRNA (guanine(2445)-N(2))-methyltransferase RlmL [Gammaproteobacteria bacterium]
MESAKPRIGSRPAQRHGHYFASCSRGLEELLAAELKAAGVDDTRVGAGGVYITGPLAHAYRACLWSRVASRVLAAVGEVGARDADELYANAVELPWEQHIGAGATIAVDFIGVSEQLRNSLFNARRVKDAVVDRLRAVTGLRPDVDVRAPDIRIVARLNRERLTLAIDLGGAQHRRGYRGATGAAPLKENLGAALLLRCGWPELAAAGGALYDPMCGSGTLLIEGALIAAGAAPGEWRDLGRQKWPGHDPLLWQRLVQEARAAREQGLPGLAPIAGADADRRVLAHAVENAAAAGLAGRIEFSAVALAAQRRPEAMAGRTGLLICNPPYGERLGEARQLQGLYEDLGRLVREEFPGWRAAILTTEGPLEAALGLRFARRYRFRNGAIDCRLLVHDPALSTRATRRAEAAAGAEGAEPAQEAEAVPAGPLSAGAEMFANRVRKNLRRIKGWVATQQPQCYRIYDADIPEYAVAVDRYGAWAHVAEYAPPAWVDEALARERLEEVRAGLASVLQLPPGRIVLKTRSRQRGTQQYQRLARENHFMEVAEGPARLLVNLRDFLDTGLFLDHRPLRRLVAAEARGKRFLNLFCYTAAVTVFAGLGGARATTSVDMSATYLDWARRNLALNGLPEAQHELVRADCLRWLGAERRRWDLVFLDPPSFSNSKRMEETLDVQRDHVALIRAALRVLEREGTLLFSTNRRGFRLDAGALADLEISDLTEQSIDPDFNRKPVPHRLYRIRYRPARVTETS